MLRKRYRSRGRMKNSKKINCIIIVLCIVVITIGVTFIKVGLNYKQTTKPAYSYSAQKSSNYEVLLKPNTFYSEDKLPFGLYYASKSVDEFLIDFKYNFKGNKKTNIEYKYNINAKLVGTAKTNDEKDKEVWNRNFSLLESKSNNEVDIEEFSIDEKVNIDYEYYNELVRSYEKTYGIAIDATLKVCLNINIFNADFVIDNDYIELDIPITNTVTYAKENYENSISKDIILENEDIKINRIIYYSIGGLLIIGTIIAILIRIKIKKHLKTDEEMYNNNITHILKYYRDLIVTVTNKPDLTNLKIMNITILEDLIDVAEQNQSNIIHYEVIKNERSNLYVIVDDYVYIYVVTSNKLK